MNFGLIASLVGLALLTGCASIVNGQNQSLSVEARSDSGAAVTGANCRLSNNKGTWFVTTPGSATVNRSFEDLTVRCDKENQEPGLASVKSSTKAMAFGNIIFGGVIGVGVDVATGAAYDYPPLISVQMGKSIVLAPPQQEGSAANPPAAAAVPPASPPVAPNAAAAPVSASSQRATVPAPSAPAAPASSPAQ